uniref:Putative secreted protein n=1 Tax=Xenopsylla cheopis TaxID=163159 RepID=A0A6M2DZS5_XENCH
MFFIQYIILFGTINFIYYFILARRIKCPITDCDKNFKIYKEFYLHLKHLHNTKVETEQFIFTTMQGLR